MDSAAELMLPEVRGRRVFLNPRSAGHGIEDALGRGGARAGLSGAGGSSLRAVLS